MTQARKSRHNPSGDAAELFEQFHGKPATRSTEVAERYVEPHELADLGRLIELQVYVDDRHLATLGFTGNVRVAATGNGGALYLVGGDQAVDLPRLGLARHLPKDHVVVGEAWKITYFTSKAFHNFEPSQYEHEFGEDGGELPVLGYDVASRKLYLTGGSYQVKPEGIVN